MPFERQLRPLVRVGLPVAVAAVLVCLAIINIALVKTWRGEPEDGVLWGQDAPGANVVAREIDPNGAGAKGGVRPGDVLLRIDGNEVRSVNDVIAAMHAADEGQTLTYDVQRPLAADALVTITLQPMPPVRAGLYYSLAPVGILSILVGASVRLRRPDASAARRLLRACGPVF